MVLQSSLAFYVERLTKENNLAAVDKKPEKNQGFNGIRTHDLRDTGAMLYQLSYEATHREQGQFTEFISSRAVKSCELYMKNINKLTLLSMCGFIAQLVEHRTGIAEVMGSNPVEALIFFRLLISNCLNWKIYCDDHTSLSKYFS